MIMFKFNFFFVSLLLLQCAILFLYLLGCYYHFSDSTHSLTLISIIPPLLVLMNPFSPWPRLWTWIHSRLLLASRLWGRKSLHNRLIINSFFHLHCHIVYCLLLIPHRSNTYMFTQECSRYFWNHFPYQIHWWNIYCRIMSYNQRYYSIWGISMFILTNLLIKWWLQYIIPSIDNI